MSAQGQSGTLMKGIAIASAALALMLTGCAPGGVEGGELTVEQCRSYYVHTYQLDGMDVAKMLGEEGLMQSAKVCSEGGVTKTHFDCAMAAKSVDALQACGPPNT